MAEKKAKKKESPDSKADEDLRGQSHRGKKTTTKKVDKIKGGAKKVFTAVDTVVETRRGASAKKSVPKKKTTKSVEKIEKKTIVKKTEKETEPNIIVKKEKPIKKQDYLYAVGRRKTAVAQARVYKKGDGSIIINEKDYKVYFPTNELQERVLAPLKLVGQLEKLKATVKVSGGGKIGQAEAVRHGISRALLGLNPNFRKPLKKAGFLTRDARKKERKKPGLKRARKRPQWNKR